MTSALVVLVPYGPIHIILSGPIKLSVVISRISEERSFDQSWQLQTTDYKNKQHLGKKSSVYFAIYPHYYSLQIKFIPLLERKPAKISWEWKTIKWATTMAIKRKAKGKRKEREIKNRNRLAKKVQSCLQWLHPTSRIFCP